MNNNDIEKLLSCVFFVEANEYERHSLWKNHNDDPELNYLTDSAGFGETIGYIDNNTDMPVTLMFFFIEMCGKRVCLYHSSGRYSDWTMVENWIKEMFPVKCDNGTRDAMCDASNFHLAINCCKEESEKHTVLSREECIFKYCPNPEYCEKSCINNIPF